MSDYRETQDFGNGGKYSRVSVVYVYLALTLLLS
jgi:hypothetical protein